MDFIKMILDDNQAIQILGKLNDSIHKIILFHRVLTAYYV